MFETHRIVKKRIGELLIERGIITEEQLKEALEAQKNTKELLGEILVDMGYATEEEVIISLTTQYGMPFLPLENYEIDHEVLKSVSGDLARRYNFIPIDKIGDLLTIVVSDILDENVILDIEKELNCEVRCFLTTPSALRKGIEKHYG